MRGYYPLAAAAASFSILVSASAGAAQPFRGFGANGADQISNFPCVASQSRRDGLLRGAAGISVLDPRMMLSGRNAAAGPEAATPLRVACAGDSGAGAEPATGPLHQASALVGAAGAAGASPVVCRGLIQFGSNKPKEFHAWIAIRPDALDLRFASAGDSWRQSYTYTRTAAGDYSVRLPAGWMSYSPSQRLLRASMTSSYEGDDDDPNNPYPVTYSQRISFRASCA